MKKDFAHAHIKWLITIVDRGKGEKIAKIQKDNGVVVQLITLGVGTAQSEIMDCLGLDEPEKDIVISIAPDFLIKKLIAATDRKVHFSTPGNGIAFSVELSGISLAASRQVEGECVKVEVDREVKKVEKKNQHELIVSVVGHEQSDLVMEGAKKGGATGGTVIRARAYSSEEAKKFFHITLQPEKEIVIIVVPHENKQDIMKAICQHVHLETGEKGIAFSIPIEDVTGIGSGFNWEDQED